MWLIENNSSRKRRIENNDGQVLSKSGVNVMLLDWGKEYINDNEGEAVWHHTGTNLTLDFHGDPVDADLVVYSDGNHHMALLEAVKLFRTQHELRDIFYTTTPPGPLVAALRGNGLRLGNLLLSRRPDVFISPDFFLNPLFDEGLIGQPKPLFRSRGNVLLVLNGNPKSIDSVEDLSRADVKTFISNPNTEKASSSAYSETLNNLGLPATNVQLVVGERIHHREAPQAVADGRADCAVLYYHLALRYVRIFPGQFEIIALGGTPEDPKPGTGNIISSSDIASVGDGGVYGNRFVEFMLSEKVAEIYRYHGMEHA